MAEQTNTATDTELLLGLTSAEAAERLQRFGPNEPVPPQRRRALVQFLQLFIEPLTFVLLVASGIAALLGEFVDATLIVSIVLASTTVNFVQAYRSQRAVERLSVSIVPTATVLRDGAWQELPRWTLVPGDVIRLTAGDLVPADARLLEAIHLTVQQAALTGESFPVEKQANPTAPPSQDPDAAHMVFLGSSVVSGSGIAEVVATGKNTLFGGIVARLGAPPLRPSSNAVFASLVISSLVPSLRWCSSSSPSRSPLVVHLWTPCSSPSRSLLDLPRSSCQ